MWYISLVLLAVATANPLEPDAQNRAWFGLVKEDPEPHLDTEGIIKRWEYPCERHNLTTEDGYILTIFRIPRGRNEQEKPASPKPVVLIQHGLQGSSDMWVNNLPHQDAAFIFADAGLDVWIGNFRGNRYGRKHVKLSAEKDEKAFFDFSWPEMSQYDLPGMVNKILQVTGAPYVYYIGHSMGTLTMFVRLAQDKEFAKKVKHFYALAPVLKLENAKGLAGALAPAIDYIDKTLYYTGMEEFFPPTWLTKKFGQYFCGSTEFVASMVCANFMFMIAGPSSLQLNQTRLPVYLAHTPAGTSRRTFTHLGQMIGNGQIGQYDHGAKENQRRYGSAIPPQYSVSDISTPISLFWGDNDWLATDRDVRNMLPTLGKSVVSKTYLGEFNHMDFLWGARAAWEVYIPILEDIKKDFEASNPKPAAAA